MKTTILLGLLLTLTVSCKHHSNPVTTEENFHTQEANRLVAEARNLWLPPLDSTFFFNDSEHISINDKEIWAKLDSALAIDPTNIKVYVGRISYLSACKKYHEILSVLRQAEKQSTLNADLWSMKAMFEDYFGDSLTAQKNYRSADSAYAILIKEYATDSLRYAGSRINRALNMALMTDNIAILEEEVELTKKIFPKTWKGPDSSFYGKNKKDFLAQRCNFLFFSPTNLIKTPLKADEYRTGICRQASAIQAHHLQGMLHVCRQQGRCERPFSRVCIQYMEVIQKLPGGKFVCHMGLPHIPEHVYLGLPKEKEV